MPNHRHVPPAPIHDLTESEYALIRDARYFDSNGRMFRLRRAWPHEFGRKPTPPGYDEFRILQRRFVKSFPADVSFRTDRTDAEIREILAALDRDPKAFVR